MVDVCAAQVEVWWGGEGAGGLVVVPTRLRLAYSPRVCRTPRPLPIRVRVALLGTAGGHVTWQVPPRAAPPPALALPPLTPREMTLLLPLPPPRVPPRRPSPTPQGSEQRLPVDTGEDEFV